MIGQGTLNMKVSPSSHLRGGWTIHPVLDPSLSSTILFGETDLSCGFVEWLGDLDEAVLKATIELQEQSCFGRLVIVRHTLIRKALAQIDASRT